MNNNSKNKLNQIVKILELLLTIDDKEITDASMESIIEDLKEIIGEE